MRHSAPKGGADGALLKIVTAHHISLSPGITDDKNKQTLKNLFIGHLYGN